MVCWESLRFPGLSMHHVHLHLHVQFPTVCKSVFLHGILFVGLQPCWIRGLFYSSMPSSWLIILAMTPFSNKACHPFLELQWYVYWPLDIYCSTCHWNPVQFFHPFFSLCFVWLFLSLCLRGHRASLPQYVIWCTAMQCICHFRDSIFHSRICSQFFAIFSILLVIFIISTRPLSINWTYL